MKKAVKTVGRYAYYAIEFFIAFVVVYFHVFVGGGLIAVGDLKKDGDIQLFVKTNGVHTDLCLPVKSAYFDWETVIPTTDYPGVNQFKYVSIGWGDKGFFLDTPEWSDLTFKTAVNAAFLPSGTAMHVIYHEKAPRESKSVAPIFISEEEYTLLIDYICNSFIYKNEKIDLIPNKGYWRNDNFYEANGNYHLFKTCNAWTNNALKLIGVKTGVFALSSDGIMRHFQE